MNAAVTNLVLSMGAMQAARRLDTTDPKIVNYFRAGYVAAQLITLGIYFYITLVIRKKNDLKVLKYVSPKSPMNPDSKDELVTTTVRDYDLSETSKAMKGLLTGIAFMCFLHLYMGYVPPLMVQGIMTIKGVFDNPEAKLHLFGAKPEGALARPFTSGPSFLDALTGGKTSSPQADAASVKALEKKGGKSE